MRGKWQVLAVIFVALLAPCAASASSRVTYGIQDDAWLVYGPGTLPERVAELDQLGVALVRYTLRWDQIAAKRPAQQGDANDPAYAWGAADEVLGALRARHIAVVLTISGAPRWANGGHGPNVAPTSKWSIASFSRAAAQRFPWVRKWLIWNEPNHRTFLLPTSPKVYVQRILNPAYAALHAANRGNRVGGGVTAPRGALSPVTWIRGMRAAHAQLDAYAHNPYPERPRTESPSTGGCDHCLSITMATLERLERETYNAWGNKRLWLTEYGYQTNPPDRILGVSGATQARYVGEAALRAYRAARVDMLIQFLVRDDARPAGWQSGLFTKSGSPKIAARAYPLPLAQVSRRGTRTVLWGQVRAHRGLRPYRLQELRSGSWRWVAGTRWTNARGFFQRTVRAGKGARFRVWSPLDGAFSVVLVVR
jgi:hypothetical protein